MKKDEVEDKYEAWCKNGFLLGVVHGAVYTYTVYSVTVAERWDSASLGLACISILRIIACCYRMMCAWHFCYLWMFVLDYLFLEKMRQHSLRISSKTFLKDNPRRKFYDLFSLMESISDKWHRYNLVFILVAAGREARAAFYFMHIFNDPFKGPSTEVLDIIMFIIEMTMSSLLIIFSILSPGRVNDTFFNEIKRKLFCVSAYDKKLTSDNECGANKRLTFEEKRDAQMRADAISNATKNIEFVHGIRFAGVRVSFAHSIAVIIATLVSLCKNVTFAILKTEDGRSTGLAGESIDGMSLKSEHFSQRFLSALQRRMIRLK